VSVPATIHATAVLAGARAVLIRGPTGAGKSWLALALIEMAATGSLGFARLVADDRAHVVAAHGRLLVSPADALAGLIEIRGFGVRRLPYEPVAVVGLVTDLAVDGAARLPETADRTAVIAGITLPRVAIGPGLDPLPLVLAALRTASSPA
jgi:HPr kinase/phosphorylase